LHPQGGSSPTNSKLMKLKLTCHKTEGVVDTANVEKIHRHKQALQPIVKSVDDIERGRASLNRKQRISREGWIMGERY